MEVQLKNSGIWAIAIAIFLGSLFVASSVESLESTILAKNICTTH